MEPSREAFGFDTATAGVYNTEAAERTLAKLLHAAPDPEAFERLAGLLFAYLPECADADMALANLDRWLGALGYSLSVQRLLTENELFLRRLLQVFATSQYFADILCRDPAYYEFLLDTEALSRPRAPEQIRAEVARAVAPFRTYEGRLDALRRAKRREILRIGVRDVGQLASFEAVVAELTAFAEAVVAEAYRIAREETERRFGRIHGLEFAVIAMGKLGGRELNYASDIDLLFVYRGDDRHVEAAHRIGERILQALSRPTAQGTVFRVDMRLRPGGGLGPLVRSLEAYRDYYENSMEHWERQALLKARFIAGDEALGRDFHALIEPQVYQRVVLPDLIEALRLNKLRLEARTEVAGERNTNVKDGYGGIRDIEFTVQLLQLLFGGQHPELRTGNTLECLAALEAVGILDPEEHRVIRQAYQFLRTVEHRLQIMDERAVRCLPTSEEALRRLARRMPVVWDHDPASEFLTEYRRCTGAVRAFLQRHFFDPFPARADVPQGVGALLLALDTEESRRRLRSYLASRGFANIEGALAGLDRLALGGRNSEAEPPDAPDPNTSARLALLARLGPHLLHCAASAPDPDSALSFAAELASENDARGLLVAMAESPFATNVLCRFGGTAPALIPTLRREPALLDMLFEPEAVLAPMDVSALHARLQRRLQGLRDYEAQLNALRRFKRQEIVRIVAADVLAALDVSEVSRRLTCLAEVCLAASLNLCFSEAQRREQWTGEPQFAIIGLGRLGGSELLYASDLDLMFVCHLPEGESRERCYLFYARIATLFQEAMTRLLPDGDLYAIDLRLRPNGKEGELVPSLDACRRYYADRAQTWERQAMLKARFLAGAADVGAAFLEIVHPFAYPEHLPPGLVNEVRAMKHRIETERTDASTRGRDLKLGPGGLSDIEFLVQLLQLLHGHAQPQLRQTNTLEALLALESAGHIPSEEAQVLREGYALQTRLRNLIYLRTGRPTPLFPENTDEQRALARALGLQNAGELLARFYHQRDRVRQVFERLFLNA